MSCLAIGFISVFSPSSASAEAFANFDQVAPILAKRCVECHRGASPAGGLDLTSQAGIRAGGDSGSVVSRKQSDPGLLIDRIVAAEMPPAVKGVEQRLPDSEIRIIRDWVRDGAKWPTDRTLSLFEQTSDVRAGLDWWSLQPIRKPEIPGEYRRQHPIDYFVRTTLESKGLNPAPIADKATRLRRLYFDLIGLPPTQEQIQSFVEDRSRDAWQKHVNELLDSPHYGERWARYWLDLVRYADTSGYERDQEKPYAWRYRDWVVDALNSDMAYSQFVTHQLAGDEIESRTEQSLIATGFLRLGTWNDEPNEPKDYVYDRLEDLVHTTSSTFLGLTVKCARCHTHKFDPIEQDDYYRFASAFWPGPIQPRDKGLLGGPDIIELGFGMVLGWTDVQKEPAPLFVLKNGEREQPLHRVVPATLSTIPSLFREFDEPEKDAKTSGRRKQLADWITDPKNPLTARVIVNRIWQHHFGEAIVRTPNNFGFQADQPTHPKLLDWLAAKFLEEGGSIKALHRWILSSKTWQQSSVHPMEQEYNQVDAANRFWWRAERRRLDAESIRDAMLESTGELDRRMGGQSFRPTINPEAIEGLSRLSDDWIESPEYEQKRRSLYMFMKRGLLPPMMTTFDLCDATGPCGKRNVSLLPTQALTLLNNRFVHDRAEYLARELIFEKSTKDRIQSVWQKILRRDPSDDEILLATKHLRHQRKLFRQKDSPEIASDSASGSSSRSVWDTINQSLVLHLRADECDVSPSGDRVNRWRDLSGKGNHALQDQPSNQPELSPKGIGGQATIHFDGKTSFMRLGEGLISDQPFTIFVVANDTKGQGHRELISNWAADKNTTKSVFLGLTGQGTVRLSDAFSFVGEISEPQKPFLLTAINGLGQAGVYHNGGLLSSIGIALDKRNLATPWVIGNQGNHENEFWKGGIAEIRVYDRDLFSVERSMIEEELADRYELDLAAPVSNFDPYQKSPEMLALASLCLVLFNSNEFMFVD